MLTIRGIFITISINVPYINLWVIINSIYTQTYTLIFYNIYVLSQVPSSICSVPCTAGFRKIHQEGTADCCFDCVQCKENEVSNETGTWLDVEENLMSLNTFSFQTRNMIWLKWYWSPKISMFQDFLNYIVSTSFGSIQYLAIPSTSSGSLKMWLVLILYYVENVYGEKRLTIKKCGHNPCICLFFFDILYKEIWWHGQSTIHPLPHPS